MKSIRLLSLLSLAWTASVCSESLEHLRQKVQPQNLASLKTASSERSAALAHILGLQALPNLSSEFEESIRKADSGGTNRVTSSQFLKSILEPALESLYRDQQRGKPFVFDPSEFIYEIDAKVKQRRQDLCHAALKEKAFELIRSDFQREFVETSERSARGHNIWRTLTDRSNPTLNREMDSLLRSVNPEISAKLGRVVYVEIVDGQARRILMTPDEGKSHIYLSLSMLVTFRTGEDSAFIELHDCLLDKLNEKLTKIQEELKKSQAGLLGRIGLDQKKMASLTQDIQRLESEIRVLSIKKRDAVVANSLMARLKRSEIHQMIGVFVSLMGSSLPTESDILPLGEWAHKQSSKSSAASDYAFYHRTNKELSKLVDHLESEIRERALHQKLIEDIRSNL